MMKQFSKILDMIESVVKFFIAASFIVMVFAMIYQVILRYIFSASNIWSEELSCFLFAYIIMLGAGIATRKGSHLQVDFLINLLKPKGKCIVTIISTFAGICFLVFFGYHAIILCESTANSISTGLKLPMTYVYASLPIGAVLMILSSIEVILKNVDTIKNIERQGGDA